MTGTSKAKTKAISPDFRIVLSRVEKEILRGENREACLKYLSREDIWKNIETEAQLKWARLAQMAGGVETSLKVLSHINRTCPEFQKAWAERMELLALIGSKEEVAQVLAEAKVAVDEDVYMMFTRFLKDMGSPGSEEDVDAASAPFEGYRRRQDAIERYLELFSGREDCFARQWVNKSEGKQGYVPVRRPLEPADIEEHLRGFKTYGLYLLDSGSCVRTAVIDADLSREFRGAGLKADDKKLVRREGLYLFQRIKELSEDAGLSPLLELSGGKGYHFWYFFDPPAEASRAKKALLPITKYLSGDLSAFGLEVFPKQDQLSGKGFGNLVKLPLGIHRLTGKRSYFLECHDRSIEGQLDYLRKVKTARLDELSIPKKGDPDEKILVHPRWKKWAEEYPALARLESCCPPIAQIIATCRQGKGISMREEKVMFQTIGFMPEAKKLLHYLMAFDPDYNPHLVDFKLSRLRGRPLGCKRIHSLLNFTGEVCPFDQDKEYDHPLLHLGPWEEFTRPRAEKVENLSAALDNLKLAISRLERFVK